jgi:hypothetical protein
VWYIQAKAVNHGYIEYNMLYIYCTGVCTNVDNIKGKHMYLQQAVCTQSIISLSENLLVNTLYTSTLFQNITVT